MQPTRTRIYSIDKMTYKGVVIQKADKNSAGMKYFCFITDKGVFRADTLAGIKRLITSKVQ
jgi:hypothetical protein